MEALRDSFGKALVEAGKEYQNLVGVSCDLKEATKLNEFFKAYPNRSFEVGIAEANAIGVATGLSLSGFRPVISSFGAFITGKNVEIRTSISYNNAGVIIVGTHGGLIGPDGATQSGLQDISVMRSMPNIEVFQPSTPLQTKKIIHYSCGVKNPIYIRIARNKVPELYDSNYNFKPKNAHVLKDGNDITIFCSGPVVHSCLKAAENLKNLLDIKVCDLPSLKPVNEKFVVEHSKNVKFAVSVEDHDVNGGLGSIISEVITSNGLGIRLYRHGLNNEFIVSGKPEELEAHFKLDANGICDYIKEIQISK